MIFFLFLLLAVFDTHGQVLQSQHKVLLNRAKDFLFTDTYAPVQAMRYTQQVWRDVHARGVSKELFLKQIGACNKKFTTLYATFDKPDDALIALAAKSLHLRHPIKCYHALQILVDNKIAAGHSFAQSMAFLKTKNSNLYRFYLKSLGLVHRMGRFGSLMLQKKWSIPKKVYDAELHKVQIQLEALKADENFLFIPTFINGFAMYRSHTQQQRAKAAPAAKRATHRTAQTRKA